MKIFCKYNVQEQEKISFRKGGEINVILNNLNFFLYITPSKDEES